jgi:hypothetical protein
VRYTARRGTWCGAVGARCRDRAADSNDWLTYLAFQILGQQVEALSGDVFLVWCSATVLLMSHGKVKLFGIGVMALAVSAEIYSYGVRYFGSGAGGVSPL